MARIRVRFQINKGRTGAPLSKLGDLSKQIERFLTAVAADVDVVAKPGEWLALNFDNGSVSYDAEFQGDVRPARAAEYARALEFIADYDPESEGTNNLVSHASLIEFARVGGLLDPDESLRFGIYLPRRAKPKWRTISYSKSAQIRREMESPIYGYGSVQGLIHTLHKEAKDPYVQLRELSTESLVRCHYPLQLYSSVVEALRERTTVVLVGGNMRYDKATKALQEIRMDRIEKARILSAAEFEQFFGSAPDLTGDLTTDEFVDMIRGNGD